MFSGTEPDLVRCNPRHGLPAQPPSSGSGISGSVNASGGSGHSAAWNASIGDATSRRATISVSATENGVVTTGGGVAVAVPIIWSIRKC